MPRHTTTSRSRSTNSRQSSSSSSSAQARADDSHLQQDVALQPLTSTSSSTARSTVSPSHAWGHLTRLIRLSIKTLLTTASAAAPGVAPSPVLLRDQHAGQPSSVSVSQLEPPVAAVTPALELQPFVAVTATAADDDSDQEALDASDLGFLAPQTTEGTLDMASKKTPFLRSAATRPDAAPYGSVSLTPSRNNSPAGSDRWDPDAHQLRHVPDTMRSETSRTSRTSRRSTLTKQSSSRLSEEIDGAVLVSGLEGRLGVAEPTPAGVLEESMKDDYSEDGALLDDASSTASESEYQENSPHEAVRASVPPTDNTTLSINTPRMWCLSVLFSILGSSTNLFFSLRYPSVAITPVIALLLVHPSDIFGISY
ncbi:hypothetical protein MRS44_006328 [Fusarium solani]|uniref:uncharacterized protein n=1 Tax=Fusarium solani TaxID=169388 RepID=UPI0032C41644|nr:hypothetical protein MRS44_006328 [Fusarium solani]